MQGCRSGILHLEGDGAAEETVLSDSGQHPKSVHRSGLVRVPMKVLVPRPLAAKVRNTQKGSFSTELIEVFC